MSSPSAVTLSKAFDANTINPGGNSTLTITLLNSNDTAAALTAPLVDTLPIGVVTAGEGSTTCGGAVTTTASSVTLTGGAIPANGSCTVTVPVSSAVAGNYVNSLAAGSLQTSHGPNAAPAIATLTVVPVVTVPSVSKTFSPATVEADQVSTLTITLINPNTSVAQLTAPLVDTLPAGVTVVGNESTTCGGTLTAEEGSSVVTLTGGSIPAAGSCLIRVDVSSDVKGSYTNTLPAGALQTDVGSNAAPATSTLIVVKHDVKKAPSVSKAFSPDTIKVNALSTLTIELDNPNSVVAIMTAPLTDTLPAGLSFVGYPTNSCGGDVKLSADGSQATLTGGRIPAMGSCAVTIKVTSKKAGSYCNKLPAGALQTDQGCSADEASATLTVQAKKKQVDHSKKGHSHSTW